MRFHFFHRRIHSCQFFPIFPRAKKYFPSAIWPTEQSTFICTSLLYRYTAWCMFLKLEARCSIVALNGSCNNKLYKSFMLLSCNCLRREVFKIFKRLTFFNALYFLPLALHNYYVRKSAFTPKVNIPTSYDRTLFLESKYMSVSAGYGVSKSQENPSRNITLMRKSGPMLSSENGHFFTWRENEVSKITRRHWYTSYNKNYLR